MEAKTIAQTTSLWEPSSQLNNFHRQSLWVNAMHFILHRYGRQCRRPLSMPRHSSLIPHLWTISWCTHNRSFPRVATTSSYTHPTLLCSWSAAHTSTTANAKIVNNWMPSLSSHPPRSQRWASSSHVGSSSALADTTMLYRIILDKYSEMRPTQPKAHLSPIEMLWPCIWRLQIQDPQVVSHTRCLMPTFARTTKSSTLSNSKVYRRITILVFYGPYYFHHSTYSLMLTHISCRTIRKITLTILLIRNLFGPMFSTHTKNGFMIHSLSYQNSHAITDSYLCFRPMTHTI